MKHKVLFTLVTLVTFEVVLCWLWMSDAAYQSVFHRITMKQQESIAGNDTTTGRVHNTTTVNSSLTVATRLAPSTVNQSPDVTEVVTSTESASDINGIIMLWSRPWGVEPETPPEGAKVGRCTVTYKHDMLKKADAVVFPYMYAPLQWPLYRHPRQRFVWFSEESPWVVRWLSHKTLKEYDNGFFNWTMSYRSDADVVVPYSSMRDLYENLSKGKQVVDKILSKKTRLAIWLVSECTGKRGATLRLHYANEMVKTAPGIRRYGQCFRNGGSIASNKVRQFLESAKFYLSFENSLLCKDYITEKFYDNAILRNSVPVVWGTKKEDYLRIAPPHSFIHAEDFSSPEELSKYLLHLDSNDTAYREYFRWREDPNKTWDDLRREVEGKHPNIKTHNFQKTGFERLCEKLFSDRETKIIHSLRKEVYESESKECLETGDQSSTL